MKCVIKELPLEIRHGLRPTYLRDQSDLIAPLIDLFRTRALKFYVNNQSILILNTALLESV